MATSAQSFKILNVIISSVFIYVMDADVLLIVTLFAIYICVVLSIYCICYTTKIVVFPTTPARMFISYSPEHWICFSSKTRMS